MLSPPSDTNLLHACQILFDTDGQYTLGLLNDIKPSTLKNAFRKKVFETHPDRSKLTGKNEDEMVLRFQEVTSAYELLKPIVKKKAAIKISKPRQPRPDFHFKHSGNTSFDNHYFKKKLPNREFLIGQFLYFSGLIPWKMLIDAIVWQKKQRPLFGQIAREWNILSITDVIQILSERDYREKFGEFALKRGYINTFQQMAIIGRQRSLQRPIGEYFIKKKIFTSEQMDIISKAVRSHNLKIKYFHSK